MTRAKNGKKNVRVRVRVAKILTEYGSLSTREIMDALSRPKKPAMLPTINELNCILAKDIRFIRANEKQPALWELRVSHVENLQEV